VARRRGPAAARRRRHHRGPVGPFLMPKGAPPHWTDGTTEGEPTSALTPASELLYKSYHRPDGAGVSTSHHCFFLVAGGWTPLVGREIRPRLGPPRLVWEGVQTPGVVGGGSTPLPPRNFLTSQCLEGAGRGVQDPLPPTPLLPIQAWTPPPPFGPWNAIGPVRESRGGGSLS